MCTDPGHGRAQDRRVLVVEVVLNQEDLRNPVSIFNYKF